MSLFLTPTWPNLQTISHSPIPSLKPFPSLTASVHGTPIPSHPPTASLPSPGRDTMQHLLSEDCAPPSPSICRGSPLPIAMLMTLFRAAGVRARSGETGRMRPREVPPRQNAAANGIGTITVSIDAQIGSWRRCGGSSGERAERRRVQKESLILVLRQSRLDSDAH